MKRMLSLALLLAVILSLCACGMPDIRSAAGAYEIRCVDETGEPVEGVTFQVCTGDQCKLVETDKNGRGFIGLPGNKGDAEVSVYMLPRGYSVLETDKALLSEESPKEEVVVHKYTGEELKAVETAPQIAEFDALKFKSLDENGNPVDSTIFSQAELTIVKLYLYAPESWEFYAGDDLAKTAELCSRYGKGKLNAIAVPGIFNPDNSGTVAPLDGKLMKALKSESGTDVPFIVWTDDFKPFIDCYAINTIFVNREGKVVKPIYEGYETQFSEVIQEMYDDNAKESFPGLFERSQECFIGTITPEVQEMYVTAFFREDLKRMELENQIADKNAKYEEWKKDLTKVAVNTITCDGESVDSSIFAGHKVTMINMWEPWCLPCKGELPALQRLNDKYAQKGFQVIGVFSAEDGLFDVLNQYGIRYDNLYFWNDLEKYYTGYVPASIFVDSEGNVFTHEVTDEMRAAADGVSDSLLASVYVSTKDFEEWEAIILDLLDR